MQQVSTQRLWLWPVIIILSALATALISFEFTDLFGRPLIALWFLVFCPGMMVIRFFRLKDPLMEWCMAIALSISLDALVVGIQVYSRNWSPSIALIIIISIAILGALIQAFMALAKYAKLQAAGSSKGR
ncbi:MAG TPA: hypothetical protein VGD98_15225 [Ktedonobacteraceae bacterium]